MNHCIPFQFSGDNMTVLNTADWLLSCSTPSSATSMSDPGIVHVCGWSHDCCVESLMVCFVPFDLSSNNILLLIRTNTSEKTEGSCHIYHVIHFILYYLCLNLDL